MSQDRAWASRLSALGYRPVADGAADYASKDGSRVIEVLDRGHTQIRELRSRLAGLGVQLARNDRLREACLVTGIERLTEDRLRREWSDMLSILKPAIGRRLALVAVGENLTLCLPESRPHLESLAAAARDVLRRPAAEVGPSLPKHFVILQVLLTRWLLGQGPISRNELGEQAGCTYPTIAKALPRIGRAVRQLSNRSLELQSFPQRAWSELLALAPSLRGTVAYVDGTGRDPDPEALLRRLRKLAPAHVALGGVVAAHHWDPHFDLQGFPRIDLSVHAPERPDLSFIERLDPALVLAPRDAPAPLLVVHPVRRPAALFAPAAAGGLPMADPVETLLDLSELRLPDQASALIDRLRARAEHAA